MESFSLRVHLAQIRGVINSWPPVGFVIVQVPGTMQRHPRLIQTRLINDLLVKQTSRRDYMYGPQLFCPFVECRAKYELISMIQLSNILCKQRKATKSLPFTKDRLCWFAELVFVTNKVADGSYSDCCKLTLCIDEPATCLSVVMRVAQIELCQLANR